jgi:hypothetical protein
MRCDRRWRPACCWVAAHVMPKVATIPHYRAVPPNRLSCRNLHHGGSREPEGRISSSRGGLWFESVLTIKPLSTFSLEETSNPGFPIIVRNNGADFNSGLQ